MNLAELPDDRYVSRGNCHLPPWDERWAAAAFQRVIQAQVITERIKQGVSIIKRVIGPNKQNTHFPARVRDPLLVQEQGFGEEVKL